MSYRSSIEFSGAYDDAGDPDIVYYNADIINDNALQKVQLGLDPVVRFQETRSTALIKDISKFYFSIVRFTMNGPNKDLPLFIPTIQLGQPDINLTAYSVGLDWTLPTATIVVGGYSPPSTLNLYSQAFVKYQTETTAYSIYNVQLPNAPFGQQDIRGVYYFVYTYQHWLDLVNATFTNITDQIIAPNTYLPQGSLGWQYGVAWSSAGTGLAQTASSFATLPAPAPANNGQKWRTADTGYWYLSNGVTWGSPLTTMATAVDGGSATFSDKGVPYILYSPSNGLFTIYVPTSYVGVNAPNVWFNTNMFGLFTNFNNQYYGDETTGKVNKLIFQSLLGTNQYTDSVTNNKYFYQTQEYNSTSTLWSPIEAIVFTSTLIPIFPEQVGEPIVYGGGNDFASQNQSTSAFSPIITDIALPLNHADDYRGFIEYVPSAEYRMSSFTSSKQELRNIDVQVFWKCRLDNNLYPVRMFNLSSVSIKMMFRKKEQGR